MTNTTADTMLTQLADHMTNDANNARQHIPNTLTSHDWQAADQAIQTVTRGQLDMQTIAAQVIADYLDQIANDIRHS